MRLNRPDVVFVICAFGVASCFEREHKHIEPRHYQPEPHLTRDILISTLSGTGPALTVSGWNKGSQFT
jgi:hypothetical protein